jgi:hypothetical protein
MRARFVRILTPHSRGSKLKNRDCARLRRAFASSFWATIIVSILKGDVPFPRRRVYVYRVSGCGYVFSPFLLPRLVRLFLSLEDLLTRSTRYLESIELPMMP